MIYSLSIALLSPYFSQNVLGVAKSTDALCAQQSKASGGRNIFPQLSVTPLQCTQIDIQTA